MKKHSYFESQGESRKPFLHMTFYMTPCPYTNCIQGGRHYWPRWGSRVEGEVLRESSGRELEHGSESLGRFVIGIAGSHSQRSRFIFLVNSHV